MGRSHGTDEQKEELERREQGSKRNPLEKRKKCRTCERRLLLGLSGKVKAGLKK